MDGRKQSGADGMAYRDVQCPKMCLLDQGLEVGDKRAGVRPKPEAVFQRRLLG